VDQTNKLIANGDGIVIRNLVNLARGKKPEKAAVLLDMLKQYGEQILKGMVNDLPPDLKDLLNESAENLVLTAAKNRALIEKLPEANKPDEEIRADIRAVVQADKLGKPTGTPTTDEINKRIESTRAKLDAFINR
jgi:hypothetical protein